MRVRDVMRKQVRTIKPNDTVSLAKELFRLHEIHHLVVVEKGKVVGVLADRDLIERSEDERVERAMGRPPVTVTSDETVKKAAALMTGRVIGSLPVVDDGKLVGIVTTYDLLSLIAKGGVHPAPAGERPLMAKRARRSPAVSQAVRRIRS